MNVNPQSSILNPHVSHDRVSHCGTGSWQLRLGSFTATSIVIGTWYDGIIGTIGIIYRRK